jgi:hypothetical protein
MYGCTVILENRREKIKKISQNLNYKAIVEKKEINRMEERLRECQKSMFKERKSLARI